jgi:trk system potassium uptake protein TrkH
MGIYAVSLLLVSLDCQDFETCFTAVAATFNNIGPGFAQVGPTQNFAFFNPLSKIVLTFDMLAGRLEIFPMLLLFFPSTWKR